MTTDERIERINQVLKEYFSSHPGVNEIAAKEMMPIFIEKGIFNKDHRNGLPIRNLLRELDGDNKLSKIPYVYPERKNQNTFWYFHRL